MLKSIAFAVALSSTMLGATAASAATDIDLNTGTGFDWKVNGQDAVRVPVANKPGSWTGGPEGTWLSDRLPSQNNPAPGGPYVFTTVLTLQNVGNMQTWAGDWWADNIVTGIRINNQEVGAGVNGFFNPNSNQNEFTPGTGRSFVFTDTVWQNGANTIEFTIQNRTLGGRNDMGFNLVSTVSAVPEPGTWLLMILGLGAVGFAMRRRQTTAVRFRFT